MQRARFLVIPLLIAVMVSGCRSASSRQADEPSPTPSKAFAVDINAQSPSNRQVDEPIPTPSKAFAVDINADGKSEQVFISGADPGPHQLFIKVESKPLFSFTDLYVGEYITKVEPIKIGAEPGFIIKATTGNSAMLTLFLWRDQRPLPIKWDGRTGKLVDGLITKGEVTFGPDNLTITTRSTITGPQQYNWDAPTASFSLTADTARSEKINKLLLEYGDANADERDLMRRVQADLPGTLNAADAMSRMSGVSLGADQITGYAYEGDALSGLTLVLNVAQPAQRSLTLEQVAVTSAQISYLVTTMHLTTFQAVDRTKTYRLGGFGLNWNGPGGHVLRYRRAGQGQVFRYSLAVDGRVVYTGTGRTTGGDPLDPGLVRVIQTFTSNQY